MTGQKRPALRPAVLSVRVTEKGRDTARARAAAEADGALSEWLRRALRYATQHMPEHYR